MPGEKYGVGIVGIGWVAGEHIRAFQNNPLTEVRALCSRREESCLQAKRQYGLECEIYGDYERMLAQKNVDIISICTPHRFHAEQTFAAAEAGKHLLIEKPVALNLEDLKRMRAVVRKYKVRTVVSFVLRWNPLFQIIKSLLAEGQLGKLFYAEVDYWHGVDPKRYRLWYAKKEEGGSSLLTGGCHAVDGLRWFVQREAREVSAFSTTSQSNRFGYEYPPNTVLILRFEDGTLGKVCSSVECAMPYNFNIDLLGDEGTIRNNRLFSHKMPGQTDFSIIPTILPDSADVRHHPFQGEIDHLVECIETGQESHVNLEDAAKTHEICFAADLSASQGGKPIKLPLTG